MYLESQSRDYPKRCGLHQPELSMRVDQNRMPQIVFIVWFLVPTFYMCSCSLTLDLLLVFGLIGLTTLGRVMATLVRDSFSIVALDFCPDSLLGLHIYSLPSLIKGW